MATRAQAVALAESFIGCRTGDKRHHKIVNTFNSVKPHGEVGNYHCPWCAMTWTALMILLKMDQSKAAYSYNCGTLITYSKKIGTWVENDAYVPLPGDGVIYYWGDSGRGDCKSGASHVGMVQKVEKGYIYVIEGNKGSGFCGVRALKVNSRYIRGFMVPKYSGSEKYETTKLDIDGSWGTMTTLVSQKVLGTFADGVVSSQDKDDKKYCINCTDDSWEWVKKPSGSNLIKAIQKKTGLTGKSCDGLMGPTSIKALQKFLNISQTGKLDATTVKAWQKWVNTQLENKKKATEKKVETPKKTQGEKSEKPSTPAPKPVVAAAAPAKVTKLYSGELPSIRVKKSTQQVIDDTLKWGKMVAKDNTYHYGKGHDAHHNGCPFCGTQPKAKLNSNMKNPEDTMCCNPFVHACWAHGGQVPAMLKLCQQKKSYGFSKNEGYAKSSFFKKVSKLKPGDVACSGSHVALYAGDNKFVQAGHEDDNKKGSKSWNSSIDISKWNGWTRAYRYIGTVNADIPISMGEYSKRVLLWQKFLNWYFGEKVVAEDSIFGDYTYKYTKKFQKLTGVKTSGKVTAATLAKAKVVKK